MKPDASTNRRLLLVVAALDDSEAGQRCAEAAHALSALFEVSILLFSREGITQEVKGLRLISLDVPLRKGRIRNFFDRRRRIKRLREVKTTRDFRMAFSFGTEANRANTASRTTERVLTAFLEQAETADASFRQWLQESDLTVAASRGMRDLLRFEYDHFRNTYLYRPLDLTALRQQATLTLSDFPFQSEGSRVIAAYTKATPESGTWHLIKAFAIAVREMPALRLLLLDAGEAESIRELAKALDLSGKVAIVNNAKNPYAFLGRAELYVQTDLHTETLHHLPEVLAIGLPVIAADCDTGPMELLLSEEEAKKTDEIGDWKKYYGRYGVLLPGMSREENYKTDLSAGEDNALAFEILAMFKDPDRMARYREKSLQRAELFSKKHYADRLLQIISDTEEEA